MKSIRCGQRPRRAFMSSMLQRSTAMHVIDNCCIVRVEAKAMFAAAILALVSAGFCPAAAAANIAGQVLGGGAPIANTTVTAFSASAGNPRQLGQARTGADGRFSISAPSVPRGSILYLTAKGGRPAANPSSGDNPAIALIASVGAQPPARVAISEMTTVATVWTHNQFIDGTTIKGPALGLKIAAGNVPSFVDLQTGGWGATIQDSLNAAQTPTMANFATLADVLAGCVTQVTTNACRMLFAAAKPPQGGAPTDTLMAAESIARYPWYEPRRVFALLDEFYKIPQGKTMRAVPYMPYLNVSAIARAAGRCSTARATCGSATTSPLAGRGRIRCGRAMPPSSIRMANRCHRTSSGLSVAACRAARSARRSTPRTTPGFLPMGASRLRCSTRTANP